MRKRPVFFVGGSAIAAFTLLLVFLWGLRNTAVASKSLTPAQQPNVIFIVVDALRADHVSAYGYGRNTTPNVEAQIAAQGARYAEATSASAWTYPANAAMLTGLLPSELNTNWSSFESSIPAEKILLAEHLHDAGYTTAGFVSAFWMQEQFGFDQGFDAYQFTPDNRAASVNQLAVDWLQTNWNPAPAPNQPLFLYLYYFDPHTWYDPPPPYDTLYDETYTGTLTAEVYEHGKPVVSGDIVPTPRDVEHLIALYDGEISYWDAQLGALLEYLDGLGLLENSIVLLTSDHGQMFGEHGKWVHRNSLYEEVLRVPLLVRYPGVIPPGSVVTTPISTREVAPLVLNYLGLLPPQDETQAAYSSRQTDQGFVYSELDSPPGPAHPAAWIAPTTPLFAVKQDGWKYVHNLGAAQNDALYELRLESVYEGDNLIDDEPEKAEMLYQDVIDRFNLPTYFWHLPFVNKE